MVTLPNTSDVHWRRGAVKSIVPFAKLKKLGQKQKARFSSPMVEKKKTPWGGGTFRKCFEIVRKFKLRLSSKNVIMISEELREGKP